MAKQMVVAIVLTMAAGEVAYADGGEISALQMRQMCRGVEAAEIASDGNLLVNLNKHPNALECWGAFHALAQAASWFHGEADDPPAKPIFLPGVCSGEGRTIARAHPPSPMVFMRVFIRYTDQHPKDGDRPFFHVAWDAFKEAWPCPKTQDVLLTAPPGGTLSDIATDGMFGCQRWESAHEPGAPSDADLRSGECTRFARGEQVYTMTEQANNKKLPPNRRVDLEGKDNRSSVHQVVRLGGGPAYYVVNAARQ